MGNLYRTSGDFWLIREYTTFASISVIVFTLIYVIRIRVVCVNRISVYALCEVTNSE